MEQEFNKRNDSILRDHTFKPWRIDCPANELTAEFEKLQDWRRKVWYVDPSAETLESQADFMIAQQLLLEKRYRYPQIIAFEYNNTDPSYNSSTIVLNGLKFLALEAPSKENLIYFQNLLHNQGVTHLVRLTPELEDGIEKTYPYWKDKVFFDPNTHFSLLRVPLESQLPNPAPYTLNYVWTDAWIDHASGNAQELLNLIIETRNGHEPGSIIACHCHSGVARTGTFIAGFILLDEIDRQLARGVKPSKLDVSIEKIVKQLSLQRFYMVGQPLQYVTLHRMLDLYVKKLQVT